MFYLNDFRQFASSAELAAYPATVGAPGGGGPVAGQFSVNLNTVSCLTAGKCLEIVTLDGAGPGPKAAIGNNGLTSGGTWGDNYRLDKAAVNGFYFQFAIWMNNDALTWVNLHGDDKKFMNLESYGDGQVVLYHQYNQGFPTVFINGSEAVRREISGVGYNSSDWFSQPSIDAGTPVIVGQLPTYLRRYGPSRQISNGLRDYDYHAAGSGIDNHVDKRGFSWPDADALQSGAVPFVIDGWLVLEAYIYNDFANDANDRIKVWAAPYGGAPKLIVDNVLIGAGVINNKILRKDSWPVYRHFEALNYPTNRDPEPGYRPAQIQRYDQIIGSSNWIPFAGHLTESAP